MTSKAFCPVCKNIKPLSAFTRSLDIMQAVKRGYSGKRPVFIEGDNCNECHAQRAPRRKKIQLTRREIENRVAVGAMPRVEADELLLLKGKNARAKMADARTNGWKRYAHEGWRPMLEDLQVELRWAVAKVRYLGRTNGNKKAIDWLLTYATVLTTLREDIKFGFKHESRVPEERVDHWRELLHPTQKRELIETWGALVSPKNDPKRVIAKIFTQKLPTLVTTSQVQSIAHPNIEKSSITWHKPPTRTPHSDAEEMTAGELLMTWAQANTLGQYHFSLLWGPAQFCICSVKIPKPVYEWQVVQLKKDVMSQAWEKLREWKGE